MRRLGFSAALLAGLLPAALQAASPAEAPWWQGAVVYEIYPRSFQDSNGDGTGDLNGITRRLDYLAALGIDAVWIAPMYPSPQIDFGYDISDYENVDPQYGTLADFDRLVAEAGRRHIRVILDMVLNHTSERHPWFQAAARSRTDPRHDWYIWSEGRRGGDGRPLPPNNWVSMFGGSAWTYQPSVRQYYYHEFYRQQPDLNWRNPQVEQAMFAAMRFWLDRGVAGFRLDAITWLFEDPHLRDEPVLGGTNTQGDPNLRDVFTNNLPEGHGVIRRMRAMLDRYPGSRVLIGETWLPTAADLDVWYGGARHDELQLPMDTVLGFGNRLDAAEFRRRLEEVETQVHGSEPLLVFDNHDNVRSWDRYGDGVHNEAIARVIATLLLTSRATALIYQGEELGQRTATPTRREEVRDPIGITGWPREKGRDGERTPMPWDDANAQAGFSSNRHPWLPVSPDYRKVNVRTELADPGSLLNWHRRLIALKRNHPALHRGRMVFIDRGNPNVLSYLRIDDGGETVLVALNLTARTQVIELAGPALPASGMRLRSLLDVPDGFTFDLQTNRLELPPFAPVVAEIR
jgi:alpha-glucosidase